MAQDAGVWIARLRSSTLARNAGWMTAGQGGNFVLQAGYFLLLARLLGVAEYGIFAGAFALVNSITAYSSLGSPMIFMRYVSADREHAAAYWGNIVAITIAASIGMSLALAFAGAKLLGSSSVALIVVLVAANCCMSQLVNAASMVFQTFEQLRVTAWLRAMSNFLRLLALAVLLLALHRATALQCSLGILASSTAAAIVAAVWVHRVVGSMRISGQLFRLRFWEGIGFSVAGSTQAMYNDVDKIMLSHYGMNIANGIYTMAYRVVDFATTPVSAIDAAVLPRFFNLNNRESNQAPNRGPSAVLRMARTIVPIAALAGLCATAFTLLASPLLVRLVGHGFADSLLAIRWLCWLPALRGVHQLAGGVLTATGLQNYRTGAQLLVAALNFGLNWMWIPTHSWLGAAWASLISDGALGIFNLGLIVVLLGRPGMRNMQLQPE